MELYVACSVFSKSPVNVLSYFHKLKNKTFFTKGTFALCKIMGKPGVYYAKLSKPTTKDKIALFHSFEVSKILKFIESNSKQVVAMQLGRVII